MQFTILAAILATITAVSAVPAPASVPVQSKEIVAFGASASAVEEVSARLDKRGPFVNVRLCEDSNGGGKCVSDNVEANVQRCYNLAGSGLDNKVTSIYINNPGFKCRFSDSNACDWDETDYYSGAYPNIGSQWNDRFSSFECWTA